MVGTVCGRDPVLLPHSLWCYSRAGRGTGCYWCDPGTLTGKHTAETQCPTSEQNECLPVTVSITLHPPLPSRFRTATGAEGWLYMLGHILHQAGSTDFHRAGLNGDFDVVCWQISPSLPQPSLNPLPRSCFPAHALRLAVQTNEQLRQRFFSFSFACFTQDLQSFPLAWESYLIKKI